MYIRTLDLLNVPLHGIKVTVQSFNPKTEADGKGNSGKALLKKISPPRSLSTNENSQSVIFSPIGSEQDFDWSISQLKKRLDANRWKYGKKE